MQDITKSSYSTYNINNYTNILDSIDIIQYPYIYSKYTISYDYTKSIFNKYKIKYSTQNNINFDYFVDTDNTQYIKELYAISHSYYDITSKYLIQNNLITATINNLYKIYNDTYTLSINSEYRIIHNIIKALYDILSNITHNIDVLYKIKNNSIVNINTIYRIIISQITKIDINYDILYNYTKNINFEYKVVIPKSLLNIYRISRSISKQIISKYGVIHTRFLGLYEILRNILYNINSNYQILTLNTLNITTLYQVKHVLYNIQNYQILTLNTSIFISKYAIPNTIDINSKYYILYNYLHSIISIYEITKLRNILFSKYLILTNKLKKILSQYQFKNTLLNIQDYRIGLVHLYHIVSKYTLSTTISHIYVSKDKYKYNLNNTGLVLKIDYNTQIINDLMNLQYIYTDNIIQLRTNLTQGYYHYDTQFNSNNINLQFIIDNYGKKNYIYQVAENTDLSTTTSNKFVLIPNQDGTYQFKTNYKFSSNRDYYPYKIYLLSSIQIQYQISNSVNQKQIKKLYLIQNNPEYNSTINITCNNKYVKLQKNYNINEKYYQSPTNKLIFIPDEQRNYYNEYTNRVEIPVKVIVYKKYITENSILIPLIIDIDGFIE